MQETHGNTVFLLAWNLKHTCVLENFNCVKNTPIRSQQTYWLASPIKPGSITPYSLGTYPQWWFKWLNCAWLPRWGEAAWSTKLCAWELHWWGGCSGNRTITHLYGMFMSLHGIYHKTCVSYHTYYILSIMYWMLFCICHMYDYMCTLYTLTYRSYIHTHNFLYVV